MGLRSSIKKIGRSAKKFISKTPMGQQLGISAPREHGKYRGQAAAQMVNTARQGGGGQVRFKTEARPGVAEAKSTLSKAELESQELAGEPNAITGRARNSKMKSRLLGR